MPCKTRDNMDLSRSVCEKIQPFIEPIAALFNIRTFGYRKFFPNGTSVGISNNLTWTHFCLERFERRIIPSYENEMRSVIHEDATHFFRVGVPDRQNQFLSALYDLDVWNTLSLYKKSGQCVEGFYFASTRENQNIIQQYVENMALFDRFTLFFKDRFDDIIPASSLNSLTAATVSPLIFQKKPLYIPKNRDVEIQKFLTQTAIRKFFLHSDDKEVSLSAQEFRALSLLSRGKTAKEIARLMNLSPRTVESYIDNVRRKTNVRSRGQLIDLFCLNFYHDKDFLSYL